MIFCSGTFLKPKSLTQHGPTEQRMEYNGSTWKKSGNLSSIKPEQYEYQMSRNGEFRHWQWQGTGHQESTARI